MCEKWNGFKNYPTWAVTLWIDSSKREEEARAHVKARGRTETIAWLMKLYPAPAFDSLNDYLLTWAYNQIDWKGVVEHYA
jgi:hypothetical protein